MRLEQVVLDVNGEPRRVMVRGADTLLDVLRAGLGLTGAKPGCENGDCGACTVIVDGAPIKACMMLAQEAAGHRVRTVEGLAGTAAQQAFVERFAFQCGYCTSGFLMVAQALCEAHPGADEGRMLEWLRSNICRCTGYEEIRAAVRDAVRAAGAQRPAGVPVAGRGAGRPEGADPREPVAGRGAERREGAGPPEPVTDRGARRREGAGPREPVTGRDARRREGAGPGEPVTSGDPAGGTGAREGAAGSRQPRRRR